MSQATHDAVEEAIRAHIADEGASLQEWLVTVTADKPDGTKRQIWMGNALKTIITIAPLDE